MAQWCGTMWVPPEALPPPDPDGGGDDDYPPSVDPGKGRSKIDDSIHSVAIVIPAGLGAKFLKKGVDLFLWYAVDEEADEAVDGQLFNTWLVGVDCILGLTCSIAKERPF